ncbi:uncharacterized protein V3H86_012140 [Mergus octosetaceus]
MAFLLEESERHADKQGSLLLGKFALIPVVEEESWEQNRGSDADTSATQHHHNCSGRSYPVLGEGWLFCEGQLILSCHVAAWSKRRRSWLGLSCCLCACTTRLINFCCSGDTTKTTSGLLISDTQPSHSSQGTPCLYEDQEKDLLPVKAVAAPRLEKRSQRSGIREV